MKKEQKVFIEAVKEFDRTDCYNPQEVVEAYNLMVKAYKDEILNTGRIPDEIKDARLIAEEAVRASGFDGNIKGLFASLAA